MRGASALNKVLSKYPDPRIRVFVIWERVLLTDWWKPESPVLQLVADPRAVQYWDPGRLLSKQLGEKTGDRNSIVWDSVMIYGGSAPGLEAQPLYADAPVVEVIETFEVRLREALR
ncbi:MAG: hypothetical protein JNL98_29580 [Bryobacterales bacterium]|nr:hypothetical protein [Bryobacterales bacterium]